eukprot:gene7286-8099_t
MKSTNEEKEDDLKMPVFCDENDVVDDLQRAFQRIGHGTRRRVRSQSYCDTNGEVADLISNELDDNKTFYPRPRSNSEPSRGAHPKKQQHRSQVHFPAPFSQKELKELSNIIAGEPDKMETIDLDFIGVSVNACKTNKLCDLVEVDDDDDEAFQDLRMNHFEKALEKGHLRLKSDKIWRYKKHRQFITRAPVDEWLRHSCNNNDF